MPLLLLTTSVTMKEKNAFNIDVYVFSFCIDCFFAPIPRNDGVTIMLSEQELNLSGCLNLYSLEVGVSGV